MKHSGVLTSQTLTRKTQTNYPKLMKNDVSGQTGQHPNQSIVSIKTLTSTNIQW